MKTHKISAKTSRRCIWVFIATLTHLIFGSPDTGTNFTQGHPHEINTFSYLALYFESTAEVSEATVIILKLHVSNILSVHDNYSTIKKWHLSTRQEMQAFHYSDVSWSSWCPNFSANEPIVHHLSPAKTMKTSKFCITGSLGREGNCWIPLQRPVMRTSWRHHYLLNATCALSCES